MRERAHLLITNPDMLHCSILPVHKQFGRLLANLRYVVVDEGHAYRCGINGCSDTHCPCLAPVPMLHHSLHANSISGFDGDEGMSSKLS